MEIINLDSLGIIYPCIIKSHIDHIYYIAVNNKYEVGFYNSRTNFIYHPVKAELVLGDTYCIIRSYTDAGSKLDLYIEATNSIMSFENKNPIAYIEYPSTMYRYVSIHLENEDGSVESILINTTDGSVAYRDKMTALRISADNSPITMSFKGKDDIYYGVSGDGVFGEVDALLSEMFTEVIPFKSGKYKKYRLKYASGKELVVNEAGLIYGIKPGQVDSEQSLKF